MSDGLRTFLAATILTGGIAGAWAFRRPATTTAMPESPEPAVDDREPQLPVFVVEAPSRLQGRIETPPAVEPEPAPPTVPPASPSFPPALPAEFDPQEPLPPLEEAYPSDPPAARVEPASDAPWLSHVVQDGDTLASLAREYLGSSLAAQDLFEANRSVLHSPDVLPIGIELRIPRELPALRAGAAPPPPPAPTAPLVGIPRNWDRSEVPSSTAEDR